ncbi:phytoene desaturase family protein [Clavibacter michiganensis]|uniref:phytoene desaturase family protein n=2 Tax=Clavibacter michiganensis TaxID=28447 RepID=UPI0026DD78C4|nr:phytoene desaturase family protein [Clavibacter michiganensis]MDO4135695.1 phytoene desaturase family protein [Clavibacter michiganensis]
MTRRVPGRRPAAPEAPTGLEKYDRVAQDTASVVIRRYSTSFGLASRLLGADVRQHIENVYALVRIADEIVDGAAAGAGVDPAHVEDLLDALEQETEDAMLRGYSTNLVVHAFAITARRAGFGAELTAPFFASMRMDLRRMEHTPASFTEYVYGSAEVVGLMCLRAFLVGHATTRPERIRFEEGAKRLGAAFQKVNFLRDLAADHGALGRSYFPGVDVATFSEADKERILDDIDHDLRMSGAVIPDLPASSRRAVALAQGLFAELTVRLRDTPASELVRTRVRVPDPVKARIALAAAAGAEPSGVDGRLVRRSRAPRVHAARPAPSSHGVAVRPAPTQPAPSDPEQQESAMTAPTAIVIGGGIAGLASAALLARDGYRVTLVEGRDEVGGRAGSWEKDGFRFDLGPSWYLMPEVFDHFFRLLGTSAAEQLDLVRLPGYRVLFEGDPDPIDIRDSREANLDLFESVEPGSRPAMARYLDSAKDVYEVAKKRFLYTTFADYRPLLKRDVVTRTGTLGKLLLTPLETHVARYVKDRRLRQILGYPAVFLGSSPKLAPSMYHLMSHLDLEDGVLYPQGGLITVIDAIERVARAEGVEIRTGSPVSRILTEPTKAGRARARGVQITTDAGTETLEADVVVSTADLHHTETELIPEAFRTYPQAYWDKATAGPGAVLVYLGVKGELPELHHHTLLFTEDWDENFSRIFPPKGGTTSVPDPASIYVCKPSATDPSVAPEGHENVFILVPIPADPTIGRGGVDGAGDARVEEIADRAIQQIGDWAGIPDLAERIVLRRTSGPGDFAADLHSWKGTILGPAHTLTQSAMFRAGNTSKKVDGLHYAGGSTIPGIGLPMCLISAEILVKRLRGDTSTGPGAVPLVRTVGRPVA